jgi:hypothetical protein
MSPSRKPIAESLNKVDNDLKPPFIQLSLELITSPAWRGRSIHCARLIDFLIIEHLRHGGSENGSLFATYDQLVEFGLHRRYVHGAITEAELLGLVVVDRGGRKGRTETHVSKFRLTFLISREFNETGHPYFAKPTGDWRQTTEVDVQKIRAQKRKSTGSHGSTQESHFVNSTKAE